MNHGPFGLSPPVFSIGFLVLFLGGGTLLSVLMSRTNKNKRMVAAAAARYQAQQLPGAQPTEISWESGTSRRRPGGLG